MLGPVLTPGPQKIVPARNRAGASATLRKNSIVGITTATVTGERAIDSLHTTGVRNAYGVIQRDVENGEIGDVYQDGELVLESDGTAVIAVGDKLIAVAGSDVSDSGRVARLPTSPVSGTNYLIVGTALTGATNVAGTELVVSWAPDWFQGQ